MREIKFRAWDKKLKIMRPVEELEWDLECGQQLCTILIGYKGGLIDSIDTPLQNPVLMQFTGLKDKNGKEIYEGDIIKTGELIAEVKIGSFYAYLENGLGDGYYIEGVYYMDDKVSVPVEGRYEEVVGNIYENPGLLEEK